MRALSRLPVHVASLVCATGLAWLVGAGCVPKCDIDSTPACQRALATADFGPCPDGSDPVLRCTAAGGYCGIEASCLDAGVTE